MRLPKKTATDEAAEKISKLRGPNRGQRGGLVLLANAFANQDTRLQRRSGRVTHKMTVALNKAFPDVDRQLIGDIVADIDSLWDTGQKLDKELRKLSQMRFPQQRNQLSEFLSFIEATQIDMAAFWIGNLRRRIPKLRKAFDQQECNERRRPRINSPKAQ